MYADERSAGRIILSAMLSTVLALHVAGGFAALVAGSVALFARKGCRIHRGAGQVFFFSMIVMAVFAVYLAVAIPGQLINVFIGIFALYFVGTGWLTVHRPGGKSGYAERIALAVALLLCAPFLLLCVQLAAGLPLAIKSSVPLEGPVAVALYGFTAVLVCAALGDALVVLRGGIGGAPRIARHLWRMCLGLTMAVGSAFTNGFARLLPGPYHVPAAFFLPQFVPLLCLVYWLFRVRLTGWVPQGESPAPPVSAGS